MFYAKRQKSVIELNGDFKVFLLSLAPPVQIFIFGERENLV